MESPSTMDMFKKKSLCAALAGIGALGVAGAAQAVNVNGDGLGQVLIYPYYTARSDSAGNAYNSLLTVVNTTASAKSVNERCRTSGIRRVFRGYPCRPRSRRGVPPAIRKTARRNDGASRVHLADRTGLWPSGW